MALVALGCCRGGSGCVLQASVWALVADAVWALGGPWMASVWALGGCHGVLGGPLWLWAAAVGARGGPWRVPCGAWWPWAVAVGALGGPWRAAVGALAALLVLPLAAGAVRAPPRRPRGADEGRPKAAFELEHEAARTNARRGATEHN